MKARTGFLLTALLILTFSTNYASEFGVYEKVVENAVGSSEDIINNIAAGIESSNLKLLNKIEMQTPNLIRKDVQEHTKFKAFVILATSPSFDSLLVNYGTRYAADWILRVGVFQNETGTHVQMANPETITRIICNDLPDNTYSTVIKAAQDVKKKLRQIILASVKGKEVATQMPPLRSGEAIRKAKKDMMMMVGPMTYFKDRSQFKIVRQVPVGENASATFKKVLADVEKSVAQFKPTEKDINYQWCPNPEKDLKWRIVCRYELAGYHAAVLGLTRNRTEALSFHICGMKRETANNLTPGIDHLTAYPIEVVVYEEDEFIKVGTPREMFRMDMYFWDAGKWAFMKYMNMPSILDKSIKQAIAGKVE